MTRDEILTMEAGREMDALVAEKVMGHTVGRDATLETFYPQYTTTVETSEGFTILAHYSTDISAAWRIVEKFKSDARIGISMADYTNGGYCFTFFGPGNFDEYECDAPTAPLAICRAALLAVLP